MPLYGYTKAGYSDRGYTNEGYDTYWTQANLRFWRPRIKIFKRDGVTLLHDYNPFNSSNDILIDNLHVSHALDAPGSAIVRLNDRARDIDRSLVGNGNKIVAQISQDGNSFYNIFSGYVENFRPMRDKSSGLWYECNAFGSGILENEKLCYIKLAATRQVFGKPQADPNDPKMKLPALAKKLLNSTDLYVIKDAPLAQVGNWDLSGIDETITENLMSFDLRYQSVATAMNHLVDRGGLIRRLDNNDKYILTYPEKYTSPITIKTLDPENRDADKITNTSYFYGPWDYELPIDVDNFANILVAVSGTEPFEGPKNVDTDPDSGTPCHDKEPCQEIICNIPDLTSISLLLMKIGALVNKFIKCIIWGSFGGVPTRDKLGSFNIDISDLIPGIPTACYATDIEKTPGTTISVGDHIYISIQPVGDADNTIVWMNDGKISIKTTKSGSRPKTTPGPGDEGKPPFTVTNENYSYNYATFYNTRTRVIAKNDASIARYGPVEKYIDVSWTKDFKIVNDILMVMLQYMSKPPMRFNTEMITISAPPLEPGQSVRVVDNIAGLAQGVNQKAIVSNVNFDFDAYGDNGYGAWFYSVGLLGIYDFVSVETPIFAQNPRLACKPIIA